MLFPLGDNRTYEICDEDCVYFYAKEYTLVNGKVEYAKNEITVNAYGWIGSNISHLYNEKTKKFERVNVFDCELKDACSHHDKEYDKCKYSFHCTAKNKCLKNYFAEVGVKNETNK